MPRNHSSTGSGPLSTCTYVVSQTSAASPARCSSPAYSLGVPTESWRRMPVSWFVQRGESASERISVCENESKLPGTWTASQPPGGSAVAQRWIRSRCVGTHCSTALHTTTSVSAGIDHVVASSTRNDARPDGSAAEIISGDESNPSTAASGHRSASSAVSAPDPQPTSTTRRGCSAPTRASRSWNGRPRSSAYRPYCVGSQRIRPPIS